MWDVYYSVLLGSLPLEGNRIEQREKLSSNSAPANPYPFPWDDLKLRWLFRAGAIGVGVRGPDVNQPLNAGCFRKGPWP